MRGSVEGDRYLAVAGLAISAAVILCPTVAGLYFALASEFTLATVWFSVALGLVWLLNVIGLFNSLWGMLIHDDILWDDPKLSRRALDAYRAEIDAQLDDEYWQAQRWGN